MTNYHQCPNPECQVGWGIEEISFQECDSCGWPRCEEQDLDGDYGAPDYEYYYDEIGVPDTIPGPNYKVVVWFTETYDTGLKNCICSLCHGTIPKGQVPIRFWSKEHEHFRDGIEMVVCETCRPTLPDFGGKADYSSWVGMVIEPGSLDEFCENMEQFLKEASEK